MPARILFLHGITMIGGAETDLLRLIGGLNRNNFFPIVACPRGGPLVEELRALRVPVCHVNLPAWRKLQERFRFPIAVSQVVRLIYKNRIDLVHVNDFWWSPIAWLASKLTKRPCVVHIRQQIEPVKVKNYWLKKPDILIAVSQEIREVAIGAGVRADQIMVAYSGIDISEGFKKIDRMNVRSLYSLDATQPVIGTVAHIFPRKGYEFLIEALEGVKKTFPDIHLLIVGDGDKDYHSKLVTLSRRLGLERSVTFVGFQRQVWDYISAFDIFVLPSVLEGFGIVLLEAMAMEKPIVASRVGGIPDIVKDGVSGLLVPPRDSVALASALLQLLHDRDSQLKMGRAGRHRLEQHFTLAGMVKVIQGIYAGLLPYNHIAARS